MGCASSAQQPQATVVNPRGLQSIPVNKSQPYRHGGPVTIVRQYLIFIIFRSSFQI